MSAPRTKARRTEPPPSVIPDNALKIVGDYADRLGNEFQRRGMAAGRKRDGSEIKRGIEFNQLAHWLWRVAGVEPSDLEPENEKKIRGGR